MMPIRLFADALLGIAGLQPRPIRYGLSPRMRTINLFRVRLFSHVRNKTKETSYQAPAARLIGERAHAMIRFRGATAPSSGRMPMLLRTCAAAFVFVISCIGTAAQPNTVDAVKLGGGRGVLTKRIDWLVASSRRTYHHIRLPERIAVGDTITLSFGSSTKTSDFSVARITLKGNHCEIFSRMEIHHHSDKISVTPCYAAGNEPTTGGRPQ
jgi:hypothetical protein